MSHLPDASRQEATFYSEACRLRGIGTLGRLSYVSMRMAGESKNMAEILATRKFPGVQTDSTFLEGHHNGNQFEDCPDVGDKYKAIAEAHGQSTTGKVYLRGLAEFPGDPHAWVSGRGDVQRLAESRGWGVSGAVNVERREVDPTPDIPLGEDIIRDAACDILEANPGMREADAIERAVAVRSGQIDASRPRVQPIPDEILSETPDF